MGENQDVTSQSWRETLPADNAKLVHQALADQTRLSSVIQKLSLNPSHNGDELPEEVLSTLNGSVRSIESFLSAFLATRFYNERHAESASGRPHRIFDLSKLVEYMLGFVSILDLFTMRQVNKLLRDTIDRSEELQNKMHFVPDRGSIFTTHFGRGSKCSLLSGLICEVVSTWNTALLGAEEASGTFQVAMEVRFNASLSRVSVPNRGYTYRAMHICQPPATEMDVFPDCCSKYNCSSTYSIYDSDPLNAFLGLGRLHSASKITSATGITIGDLYDAIEKVRAEHKLCPRAYEISNHDDNGNYWPIISFGCLLNVREDDPIVDPRVRAGCVSIAPPPPPNWRIWDYVDAKQQGERAHVSLRESKTNIA